jgi:hypothetical protein
MARIERESCANYNTLKDRKRYALLRAASSIEMAGVIILLLGGTFRRVLAEPLKGPRTFRHRFVDDEITTKRSLDIPAHLTRRSQVLTRRSRVLTRRSHFLALEFLFLRCSPRLTRSVRPQRLAERRTAQYAAQRCSAGPVLLLLLSSPCRIVGYGMQTIPVRRRPNRKKKHLNYRERILFYKLGITVPFEAVCNCCGIALGLPVCRSYYCSVAHHSRRASGRHEILLDLVEIPQAFTMSQPSVMYVNSSVS